MKATEKELQDQANNGDRLRILRGMSEWDAVTDLLVEMYAESLQKLTEEDDPKARATLKVLQDFADRIDGQIKLSDSAHKDLLNGNFIKERGTE